MGDDGIHEFLAGPEIERLGLAFNALPPNPIIIKRVSVETWADEEGIQPGDVLLALNGVDVSGMTPDEFKATMQVRPLSVRIAEVWQEEEPEKNSAEEKRATVFDADSEITSRIECLAKTRSDSAEGENNCVPPTFTGQSNEVPPLQETKPSQEMNASGEQPIAIAPVVSPKDLDSKNVTDKVEIENKSLANGLSSATDSLQSPKQQSQDRQVARGRMMLMRPSPCCGQQ